MLKLTPFTETDSFKEAFQEVFAERFQEVFPERFQEVFPKKFQELFPERFQEKLPEKLKEDRVQRLIQIIDAKFRFSRDTINKLAVKLNQLTLEDLKNLFGDIFRLKRLKDLNEWLDSHLPPPQNDPSQLAKLILK